MAAERLLDVLSLCGFKECEAVAPALRRACEDTEAQQVVLWLAENLTPEQLTASSGSLSDPTHSFSESEQRTATAFASSLESDLEREHVVDEELVQKRRNTTQLLDDAAAEVTKEAKKLLELRARESCRLNTRLEDLQARVAERESELTDLLAELDSLAAQITAVLTEESASGELICSRKLEEYRALDGKMMAALKELYSSQFGYALEEDGEAPKLSPDVERLLFGEGEGAIEARAIEIERVRIAHGAGLERRVRALALQAKHEKSLQALQGALTRPELSSQDTAMLRAESEKQQASLDRLAARKTQILDVELPQLCDGLASMHCWDAVKAEYDVELARNKYYLEKKDFMLDTLLARAARLAALVGAARAEAAALGGWQDALQVMHEDMRGLSEATEMRLAKCAALPDLPPAERPVGSPVKNPRAEEIEDRQREFCARAEQLLGEAVPSMQKSSGLAHALAFGSPEIEAPCLTTEGLAGNLKGLERLNVQLMEANEAVYRQQEAYNNAMRLRRDQVGLERSVFPTFFANPEQLIRLAREAGGGGAGKPRGSPPRTAAARKPRPSR